MFKATTLEPLYGGSPKNEWKYFIAIVIIGFIVLFALKHCSTPVTTPDIQKAEESREKHVIEVRRLEPLHDTVYADRFKIKHHYEKVIDTVETFDSTKVRLYYDSLVQSQINAVILYYRHRSCSTELQRMDSVHVIDSAIKAHLKASNVIADTLIDYWQKQAKKRYLKGLGHGVIIGYGIGEVKNILIKR